MKLLIFFWKKKIDWQKFFLWRSLVVRGGRDWCSIGCDWCASRIRTLRWGFGQGEESCRGWPNTPVGLHGIHPRAEDARGVRVCNTRRRRHTRAAVLTNSHVSHTPETYAANRLPVWASERRGEGAPSDSPLLL